MAGVRRSAMQIVSRIAFVYLASVIVVMGSERIYWYWAGFTPGSVLEMALFYAIPTAAALWALALLPSTRFNQVVLAGAVFAFIVEGVLTPIIYTDGPFPLLASLFVGWHGMFAFAGLFYLTRRWLLAGRIRLLLVVSSALGALWGVWAYVAAFGDPAEISTEAGSVLEPSEFALYATAVALTLALSHWLIGFVWPTSWRPKRWSTWLVVVAAVGYFAVAVLLAVPWAPLKLGILLGGTLWLMRRGSARSDPAGPSVLHRLSGRVPALSVLAILPMALTATATYGAVSLADPGSTVLGTLYWLFVLVQVLGGAVAFVWAAVVTLQSREADVTPAVSTDTSGSP